LILTVKMNSKVSEMLAEEGSSAGGASSHDPSESGHMSAVADQKETKREADNVQIAKAEDNLVFWSRLIVLAVLVVSTVSVALVVYFYTSDSEEDEFERQFISDSQKVFEAVGTSLDLTLGAADAFVVKVLSYARYSNSTWPFVTAPDFAVQAAKLLGGSAAVHCNLYPLVSKNQRTSWEQYSLLNDAWVEESINVQARNKNYDGPILTEYGTLGIIHNNFGLTAESAPGPYAPSWQSSPVVPYYNPFNWDGLASGDPAILYSMDTRRVVINGATNLPDDPNDPDQVATAAGDSSWASSFIGEDEDASEPFSNILYPIIDSINDVTIDPDDPDIMKQPVVGIFALTFYWRDLIKNLLPPNSKGVIVVFENTCEQVFTYRIDGEKAFYVGQGDHHDSKYDYLGVSSTFLELRNNSDSSRGSAYTGLPLSQDFCLMTLHVYPSEVMENEYLTSDPVVFTVVAALIFVFTSLVFFLYDWLVQRRQKKVMSTAMQSSAIVSSLFPSQVRDRLFPTDGVGHEDSAATPSRSGMGVSPPVADLYPDATVMFADISGFTAWSSVREPTQVFTLLETLYGAFDAIAKKRGVFKVETIGDSYVAVVGLPDPRKDHAVVMARFARDCRDKMAALTRELEVTLGPGTENLQLRFGLHSGPVTAGVLRGEKSRFQLFGDTVNTAARMESTGIRNLIQVSQTTAELLIAAGKEHWVNPRDELVEAKGKGKMQTYWVEPKNTSSGSVVSSAPTTTEESDPIVQNSDRIKRLVDWNADILGQLLRLVIAKHDGSSTASKRSGYRRGEKPRATDMPITTIDLQNSGHSQCQGSVLDEVKEIIELPEFDAAASRNQDGLASIELESTVATQLHEYVSCIAAMYKMNPFHNFEHASHVTMSVVKLLGRIIAPKKQEIGPEESRALGEQTRETVLSSLHDHTYGITSDPLTQFACVFAALIHDVDHPGVPNTQLVKENVDIATAYQGKSVAEQNSVDLAWNMFMEERFSDLRRTLCSTDEEMRRFRQLVVNSVMATDIMDRDLKALRDGRWGKAFQETPNKLEPARNAVNRKATIVIEHLIQASDIAHTMQHWHIYRKWNERLFEEMYEAYLNGRAEKDPSEFWYQGEIGFFDFYIIPLAKKLDECGVFGVSSNEYLSYATKNRKEWEDKGKEIVADMLEKYGSSQL
jgi:class 3 adenylate cyclase